MTDSDYKQLSDRLAKVEQVLAARGWMVAPMDNREHKPYREIADRLTGLMCSIQGVANVASTQEQREIIYSALNEGFTEPQLVSVIKAAWKEVQADKSRRPWFRVAVLFSPKTLPDSIRNASPKTHASTSGTPQPKKTPAELIAMLEDDLAYYEAQNQAHNADACRVAIAKQRALIVK